jgi:hypothetical protein
MKKIVELLLLFIIFSLSVLVSNQRAIAQQAAVSFQVFYDDLSPYGNWLEHPAHGYVWIPNADVGFRPYSTNGHWVYTDDGWAWFSDFPWGWAPFHYGRWFFDPLFGWMWLPGTEWGPAWVVWRHAPGCYGWAPLAPGISLELAFATENIFPRDQWIFVKERNILSQHLSKYYIHEKEYGDIIKRSNVISTTHLNERTHVKYIHGPERVEIEQITNKKVEPVVIHDYDRPGHSFNKGSLSLYRPQVIEKKEGPKEEPGRVYKMHELKLMKPKHEKQKADIPKNDRIPKNNYIPNQKKEQRPPENRQKIEKQEQKQQQQKRVK